MSHNFDKLQAYILPLSNSDTFHIAKNEWKLIGIEIQEDWDNCPCGQSINSNPRSWCKLLILKELIINQLCCKLLFYK